MKSEGTHLEAERLLALAAGAVSDEAEARHLSGCPACSHLVETVQLARLPGTEAAEQRLARALRTPAPLPAGLLQPEARPQWRPLAMAVSFAIAVAAVAIFAPPSPVAHGGEQLAPVWAKGRPTDARFELELPWSPLRLSRGAPSGRPDVPVEELFGEWERDPARHTSGLVAAFVARGGAGDLDRAEEVLARRPNDAPSENDRGVVAHAAGRPADALRHFDESLRLRPRAPHVWFNRAVALEALGRAEEAAAAFEAYLALANDGDADWSVEARRRMEALRPR